MREHVEQFKTLQRRLSHIVHKVRRDYSDRQTWRDRERRAEATGAVNYGCNFDADGRCAANRDRKDYDNTQSLGSYPKCCCTFCGPYTAYLDAIPKEAVPFCKQNFDLHDGFWRPNVGCILPRKWRSNTCLEHNCLRDEPRQTLARAINYILDKTGY